ncbi:MAG: AbrB/MazE/SpoVT family DNA-binding domain-containing protein [Syntrophorhabdales bacterium]|jgi:AbrB family looped-hinge helix DNA binding protein
MRVTSKGQVTIPLEIRDKLGLGASSEVEFELLADGKVCLTKVDRSDRRRALVRKMKGRATTRLSTDEIMKLTRG